VSGVPEDLLSQVKTSAPEAIQWRDSSALVYVKPIMGGSRCGDCHAAGQGAGTVLGMVVVRTDLSAVDSLRKVNLQTTFLVGGGAFLMALLLLFGGFRVLTRGGAT
jgi:hypothetical protein